MLARTILVSAVAVLSACSTGSFDYVSKGAINLVIAPADNSERTFRRRWTNVAIHQEKSRCDFEYLGSVVLGEQSVSTGLPVGSSVMVQFNFIETGKILSNYDTISSTERVFLVRPGASYRIEMEHRSGGASFSITENGREMDLPDIYAYCPA